MDTGELYERGLKLRKQIFGGGDGCTREEIREVLLLVAMY